MSESSLPESSSPTPADIYTERISQLAHTYNRVQRRWGILGNVRLLAAIAAAIALWQAISNRNVGELVVFIVLMGLYAGLSVVQRGVRMQRDATSRLQTIAERALARLNHDWDSAPMPPDAGVDRQHPYAFDLNIVGRASVAHRIGTPVTHHGWVALYESLLELQEPNTLAERQAAVNELAGETTARAGVEAAGVSSDEPLPDPDALIAWAESPGWLGHQPILRAVSFIGPIALLILLILWAVGILPWIWMLLPIALNTMTYVFMGKPASERVQAVAPFNESIAIYRDVLIPLAETNPQSELTRRIYQTLVGEGQGASAQMSSLARSVSMALPADHMLYVPLQMTTMWDVHVLAMLERFQQQAGGRVRRWFEAFGEWEALAALSVLHHDHPTWVFADVRRDAPDLVAEALAHPLLPTGEVVANDVELGPRGTFLFITGSNMSGKSTLLRAIGSNAVLAQAGAPCAARSFTMPPLRISSCMRVEDSLEKGVSFFMAELQRLKAVIDDVQRESSWPALYLLDEILQGTNTGERQIASREVLRALTREDALGAISSHDLELIEGTDLANVSVPVHFSEQFTREGNGAQMTFDYRLRPGLATSSNALKLMELLGFDLDVRS